MDTESYFSDDYITGAMKYKADAASNDTDKGVTLTGAESKGVKASDDGKKLVYARSNFNVSSISLGQMAWGDGRDASGTGYDYGNVTNANIDVSGLTFINPEEVTSGTVSDLLTANATLTADLAGITKDTVNYSYSPVAGVTVDGTIIGSLIKEGNTIKYQTADTDANKATKLTFGNVEWKDEGALMARPANITFAGAAVDTSKINFTNIQSLEANKKMTLVKDFGNTVGTITGTEYTVGTTLKGKGKATLADSDGDSTVNDLIFTAETAAESLTAQEQTHNTLMGAAAGMAALSAGNDFVGEAAEGIASATNTGTDGVAVYGNMGGGSLRQETGSHVDAHTWNAILAVGHRNAKEKGSFDYGAFFEYGRGNYTTVNGDQRGDGDTHYTGGGFMAKYTLKNGVYAETSLRAGRITDNANSVLRDALGNGYSYKTSAPYYGFHLGVGKVFDLGDGRSVDLYGKFFYNHRNGVSFNAGGAYDLDAVNSQLLRLGARYTMKRDSWNYYAGLAYEYELDGKATGTADGVAIRAASTKGGSLRGELGATFRPSEDSPWNIDLNVSGFAGKKRGVSGGVSVAYMF